MKNIFNSDEKIRNHKIMRYSILPEFFYIIYISLLQKNFKYNLLYTDLLYTNIYIMKM